MIHSWFNNSDDSHLCADQWILAFVCDCLQELEWYLLGLISTVTDDSSGYPDKCNTQLNEHRLPMYKQLSTLFKYGSRQQIHVHCIRVRV